MRFPNWWWIYSTLDPSCLPDDSVRGAEVCSYLNPSSSVFSQSSLVIGRRLLPDRSSAFPGRCLAGLCCLQQILTYGTDPSNIYLARKCRNYAKQDSNIYSRWTHLCLAIPISVYSSRVSRKKSILIIPPGIHTCSWLSRFYARSNRMVL